MASYQPIGQKILGYECMISVTPDVNKTWVGRFAFMHDQALRGERNNLATEHEAKASALAAAEQCLLDNGLIEQKS